MGLTGSKSKTSQKQIRSAEKAAKVYLKKREEGIKSITCRLRPGFGDLAPMPDFVESFKTVYLKGPKGVSNAVAILTLQVPVTARVYDSVGAPWSMLGRSLPDEKFATSHALISEARIVGDPREVDRAIEGYMAGTLKLQSAFQVHNGSAYYYEVGEWVEENNAGKAGKNGCVQGIYGFASLAEAFDWTMKMYKSTPAFATKVSKAIKEGPDGVEEWFRWNDLRSHAQNEMHALTSGSKDKSSKTRKHSDSGHDETKEPPVDDQPDGKMDENEPLITHDGDDSDASVQTSMIALDLRDKCLACTRALSKEEATMRYKPCGHGPFCPKCRATQLGAACPLCAVLVVRADRWKRWSRPVETLPPLPQTAGAIVSVV